MHRLADFSKYNKILNTTRWISLNWFAIHLFLLLLRWRLFCLLFFQSRCQKIPYSGLSFGFPIVWDKLRLWGVCSSPFFFICHIQGQFNALWTRKDGIVTFHAVHAIILFIVSFYYLGFCNCKRSCFIYYPLHSFSVILFMW